MLEQETVSSCSEPLQSPAMKIAEESTGASGAVVETLVHRHKSSRGQFGRLARFSRYFLTVVLWGLIPVSIGAALVSVWAGDHDAKLISSALGGITILIWFSLRSVKRKQSDYATLAQYDDVRAIIPLVYALDWTDGKAQNAIGAALTRLLPMLKANEVALLPYEEQTLLARRLTRRTIRTRPEFGIAMLKALEQVGDGRLAPVVQKLADSRPTTASERRVRFAAVSCLPFLLDREEQKHSSGTLLRSAALGPATDANLLLPAAGRVEGDPGKSLRPAAPPRE